MAKRRKSWKQIANEVAETAVRHWLFWVGIVALAGLLAAIQINAHLQTQFRRDLGETATFNLLLQGSGFTFPNNLVEGMERLAASPPALKEQLFNNPVATCNWLKCEEIFGVPLDETTIVTLTSSVRDVTLRRATVNSTTWGNLAAGLSLLISVLTFALTAFQQLSNRKRAAGTKGQPAP